MLQTFFDLAPSCRLCQFFIQNLPLCFAFIYIISNSHFIVTWYSTYVDNINFNELLWNYKFIYYENLLSLKIRPFILWKSGAIRYWEKLLQNHTMHVPYCLPIWLVYHILMCSDISACSNLLLHVNLFPIHCRSYRTRLSQHLPSGRNSIQQTGMLLWNTSQHSLTADIQLNFSSPAVSHMASSTLTFFSLWVR